MTIFQDLYSFLFQNFSIYFTVAKVGSFSEEDGDDFGAHTGELALYIS